MVATVIVLLLAVAAVVVAYVIGHRSGQQGRFVRSFENADTHYDVAVRSDGIGNVNIVWRIRFVSREEGVSGTFSGECPLSREAMLAVHREAEAAREGTTGWRDARSRFDDRP